MTISTEIENIWQHPTPMYNDNNLLKAAMLGIAENHFNMIKKIYKKTIASIILNRKKLNKGRMSALTTILLCSIRSSSHCNKKKKMAYLLERKRKKMAYLLERKKNKTIPTFRWCDCLHKKKKTLRNLQKKKSSRIKISDVS